MGYPNSISGKRADTETQIVNQICEYFNRRAFFFWRQNNIPVYGRSLPKWTPRGMPDVFLLHDGYLIGVEVKRPASAEREPNGRTTRGGKLSVWQAEFGSKLVIHGGHFLVVRSLNELQLELDLVFVRHNKDMKTANDKNDEKYRYE